MPSEPVVTVWQSSTNSFFTDTFGLIIDPIGSCDDESGFSWSDPDIASFASTDTDYFLFMDDQTANNASPPSNAQFKLRIRLRKIRIHIIGNDPVTWGNIKSQITAGHVNQAILMMLAYWIANALGW